MVPWYIYFPSSIYIASEVSAKVVGPALVSPEVIPSPRGLDCSGSWHRYLCTRFVIGRKAGWDRFDGVGALEGNLDPIAQRVPVYYV